MQGHALEHSAHCGGGLWLESAMTLSLCLKYNRAIWRAHLAHQMRLDQQSAVSQNAVSRGHLQRRHSYFLSIASDPIDDGCQWFTVRRSPGDSPLRSIPVRDPNPSRFMYSYIDSLPTRRPSLIAPTLLDFARASATV